MMVGIPNGHLPDIIQGKPQILQKKNLMKPGKILIRIESGTLIIYQRWFQNIMLIVITYGLFCDVGHSGKFS